MPQYRHVTAFALMSSAQNGHLLLSPELIILLSITLLSGFASAAQIMPISGLKTTDSKKKPNHERPLLLAIAPATMLKNTHKIKAAMIVPYY